MYKKPKFKLCTLKQLADMLRCSCGASDDNPYVVP